MLLSKEEPKTKAGNWKVTRKKALAVRQTERRDVTESKIDSKKMSPTIFSSILCEVLELFICKGLNQLEVETTV